MQQVITKTHEITWTEEEGILRVRVIDGANLELKDVKEYYAFTDRITGGRKVLVIVDGTTDFTITEEARQYSAMQAEKTRIATALITRSKAMRMLANLYIQFNKPQSPTRMFTDEETALKWLGTFKK